MILKRNFSCCYYLSSIHYSCVVNCVPWSNHFSSNYSKFFPPIFHCFIHKRFKSGVYRINDWTCYNEELSVKQRRCVLYFSHTHMAKKHTFSSFSIGHLCPFAILDNLTRLIISFFRLISSVMVNNRFVLKSRRITLTWWHFIKVHSRYIKSVKSLFICIFTHRHTTHEQIYMHVQNYRLHVYVYRLTIQLFWNMPKYIFKKEGCILLDLLLLVWLKIFHYTIIFPVIPEI